MAIEYEPRRFTVDEYHRLVKVGILDETERVELLDGQIVAMSPIGKRHWLVHAHAVRYLNAALGEQAIVSGQGSFPLGFHDEPQPDVAVLAPSVARDFETRAEPSEILAMIEIAETSLAKDRKVKLPLYARFGILDYIIVDLKRDVVVHHTEPHGRLYSNVATLRHTMTFQLAAFPAMELQADAFLPSLR